MADIATTRIFTDGEKGITATKMNDIIGSSSIQTSFVSSKPVASSTVAGDNLLLLTSGGSYAKIDSSVFSSSIAALLPAPEPAIWNVRLRSFNAVGNPNFETDQSNVNALITNAANSVRIADRWFIGKTGTMTVNTLAQNGVQNVIPGTNYVISGTQQLFQLGTQQTTLGAGDFLGFQQSVEGPAWRELRNDVHSLSLLVYSTVAPTTFAVALRDNPATKSLVKTATISTANTWTLVQFPNLPVFPAGNFTQNLGAVAYTITITLAGGTTFQAPSAGVWATGNYISAAGVSNWCANPITTTQFYCSFVQHEPGAQCTTLQDCSFGQNLDGPMGCLRYFCKSYDYSVKPGTATLNGSVNQFTLASDNRVFSNVRFPKVMSKAPTVTCYSGNSGLINTAYRTSSSSDWSVTSILNPGQGGFVGPVATGSPAGFDAVYYHWTADTGW